MFTVWVMTCEKLMGLWGTRGKSQASARCKNFTKKSKLKNFYKVDIYFVAVFLGFSIASSITPYDLSDQRTVVPKSASRWVVMWVMR